MSVDLIAPPYGVRHLASPKKANKMEPPMSYSAKLQLNVEAGGNPYHALAASLPETNTETDTGDGQRPGRTTTQTTTEMDTVLVLTGRSDITADAVVDELARRRASVVRYDTKDFPVSSKLAATLGSQGWQGTLSGDHRIELESVSSVWWRRPGEFAIPPDWSDEARAFAASEGRVGVLGVLGSLSARWINHPSRDSAANYKPVQLAAAARAGLEIPRTVITSDLEHAREFVGRDEVVYKGLSGGVLTPDSRHRYIPTTLLRAGDLDEALAGTAHLFQERVPKAFEVRLTVIGNQMFPVAIHTGTEAGKLDWRTDYASLTISGWRSRLMWRRASGS